MNFKAPQDTILFLQDMLTSAAKQGVSVGGFVMHPNTAAALKEVMAGHNCYSGDCIMGLPILPRAAVKDGDILIVSKKSIKDELTFTKG